MNALINWFVEGIDGVLVILVCAAFILLALSSFFGRAKVRWWFTCGDRWRWWIGCSRQEHSSDRAGVLYAMFIGTADRIADTGASRLGNRYEAITGADRSVSGEAALHHPASSDAGLRVWQIIPGNDEIGEELIPIEMRFGSLRGLASWTAMGPGNYRSVARHLLSGPPMLRAKTNALFSTKLENPRSWHDGRDEAAILAKNVSDGFGRSASSLPPQTISDWGPIISRQTLAMGARILSRAACGTRGATCVVFFVETSMYVPATQ
jgi:hypothetical protein